MQVIITTLAGLFVVCLGVVNYNSDFVLIKETSLYAQKNFDAVNFRPSFMIFNHRGRNLGLTRRAAEEAALKAEKEKKND